MSSKRRKSRCKRARAETFGQALDSCPTSTTFAAAHTKTNPSTSNHHWGLCEQIRRGSRQQCRRLHRKEEWRFYPQENDWPDPTNLKESTHKLLSRIVHPKTYFLGGRKIASYMWTKRTWWRLSRWLLLLSFVGSTPFFHLSFVAVWYLTNDHIIHLIAWWRIDVLPSYSIYLYVCNCPPMR